MSYRVIASTMGKANPSPVESGVFYRYKGREGWPLDPASHDRQETVRAVAVPGSRAGRVRRYAEARDSGLSRAEAAAAVEITAPTARDYEREYQASKGAAS